MLQVHENCRERFEEAIEFARKHGLTKQLADNFKYLAHYAMHNGRKTRCMLYKDFAPLSFEFVIATDDSKCGDIWRRWFNGGVIFHGQHDGFGSGGAPTFSVCLTKTDGWQIHT